MELYRTHGSPWTLFVPSPSLFHAQHLPDNYVQWTQTPDSHLFSADLPGMRKEEIRVELEDSRYLVIRTELSAADHGDGDSERRKKEFMRKFRLPAMVDVEGISAAYEDGLLTVRVPRAMAAVAGPRGQLRIELVGDEASDVLRGGERLAPLSYLSGILVMVGLNCVVVVLVATR